MATSPACATATHRALPLVLAAALPHLRPQKSPTPHVTLPTHPVVHWPSSWLSPVAPLVATPQPLLLYLSDTIPSSSSSFGTSLLVYHLLLLSPNVCRALNSLDIALLEY